MQMYDNNVFPKQIDYKLEPRPNSSAWLCSAFPTGLTGGTSNRHKELQEIHWKFCNIYSEKCKEAWSLKRSFGL